MADLSLAPGDPYVEVEYDYEYKSKERLISIHQGEHFLLVKKTNEDWWQVRREPGSRPFYVPAQYVREVRKALMPPPQRAGPRGRGRTSSDRDGTTSDPEDDGTNSDHAPSRPAGGGARRESTSRRSAGHTLPRSRGRSPERRPLDVDDHHGDDNNNDDDHRGDDHHGDDHHGDDHHGDERHGDDHHGDERHSDDHHGDDHHGDSGDEPRTFESESDLSSSSTEMLQSLSSSSLPPLPSLPSLSSCGDWESHRDAAGRLFFVNKVTQERSWKPPRERAEPGGERAEPGGERAEPGGERAEPGGERAEPGTEQWLKTVDDQGRTYFYRADGSRSEWELPKLVLDGAKTRSLDRRSVEPIVLNRWRHSSHNPESERPSEKCGVLNVTKITENGKKLRKSWTSSWTVLQGSTLLFTKGQTGGSSWFGAQSKPELTVDLRGATVDWAPKDRSSKKNVLELKTRQGTELLIQSDTETTVQDWLRALQDSISAHAWESDEALEDDRPESPGRDEKNDRDREHRKVVKSSSSLDVSENKKTRHRLKKFLMRRPTLQAVRDKGYIKDQVFGCSLADLCHRENVTVPSFVQMCIDHVENNGLSVDGLYRVSGNLAVIQKLRFAVNHDERVCLTDLKWEDIHVTTGALKMFFRELPEPLFTYSLFHNFVSAIKSPDYRVRVQSIKDLVRLLPKVNHDTMRALFTHLRRVVDRGEDNRMTIQSVAIVFGPTLLRPETETWNMAVHMVYQNQIVELILIECEGIFGR